MKLAILVRGLSYHNYKGTLIDYKICLKSFKECILSTLSELFEEIDFFLLTYYNEVEIFQQLLEDYKPKDLYLLPKHEMKSEIPKLSVGEQIANGLGLIKNYKENYSFVLETRFDLYYYRKLQKEEILLDKINISWRGESGQCDDAFILFPIKFIDDLINYYSPKGTCTHYLNFVPNLREYCHYLSKDLDPENGYHFPDFFIFQRVLKDYLEGNLKVY